MTQIKFSIIIPAYNEEKRILPTLKSYYDFFKKSLDEKFEMIIVPNNCSDNTSAVVNNFAKGKKEVQVFEVSFYSGKGGAVMKGFSLARGEFVGFTDADGSTDAENFYNLYKEVQGLDGVIGSRRIKGAVVNPKRGWSESLSSWVFSRLTSLFFNWNYEDTQCGAKIFTWNTVQVLISQVKEVGWIFDVDILNVCRKNDFKIKEIPIHWHDCRGSKLIFKDKITSLFQLIRYWWKSK